MKLKLRIAGAALLATAMAPAWALQLGQIEVKSALNQPLVAAIPLHPKNLSELDGLTVQLGSAADFARAGLQQTATDRTLRFHVVTDNNGQKLILVTSSQPVSDPYLDFLVEVNTRQGKQVREFVVLLNPVISAPAPAVQTAPVATPPVAAPPPSQPAELPPPEAVQPAPQAKASTPTQPQAQQQATPKPQAQPQPESAAQKPTQSPTPPKPQPAPQPPSPSAAPASRTIPVQHGDTLYEIAKDVTPDTGATINQMMMALKSANPEAFFKDNINDLKAGAILRIPTREQIDQTSIAEANAAVHRQYEVWRSARPHPATVVEGTAANAAARTAPKPAAAAPEPDHLALVPPSGGASGTGNRPGAAGGTGNETVAGMQQRLQNERGTLTSLEQSNADLESRVHSLEDLAGKSGKLLSFKEATVAELQRKLAAVQSGKPLAAASPAAVATAAAAAKGSQPGTSAPTAAKPASKSAATKSSASATPWFGRPLTWIVAAVIVLALILIGLLARRRGGKEVAAGGPGPLTDPEDLSPQTGTAAYQASLEAQLAENPDDLGAHLSLCRLYHADGDAARFVAAAEAMHAHVREPGSLEWHEVAVMGEELAPGNPLFAAPAEGSPVAEVDEEPEVIAPYQEPAHAEDPAMAPASGVAEDEAVPEVEQEPPHATADAPFPVIDIIPEVQQSEPAPAEAAAAGFNDDPVDTKLDLARAYLDMGDPVGARAMLDEVVEEGSQAQRDEARRLLSETTD